MIGGGAAQGWPQGGGTSTTACTVPGAGTSASTSGPRFQAKRIHVVPGGRLSLQKHFHRAEHWLVIQGVAEVTVDKDVSIVRARTRASHLPLGCVHRMVNPGKIPLEIVEVQIGSYTGEDDIVRIEDVYGR